MKTAVHGIPYCAAHIAGTGGPSRVPRTGSLLPHPPSFPGGRGSVGVEGGKRGRKGKGGEGV